MKIHCSIQTLLRDIALHHDILKGGPIGRLTITADEAVYAVASGSTMSWKTRLDAQIVEPGTAHIDISRLTWLGKKLGRGLVELSSDGETIILQPPGTRNSVSFPSMTDESFEHLEFNERKAYPIRLDQLREALSYVMHSSASKKKLPGFSMVVFNEYAGHLDLCATDRKRLSLATIEKPTELVFENTLFDMADIRALMPALQVPDGEVYLDMGKLFLRAGNHDVTVRIVEGNFPRYRDVIPEISAADITIDGEKLDECLDFLSGVYCDLPNEEVSFRVNGKLMLEAERYGDVVARTEADCSVEGVAPDRFLLNGSFLRESLAALDYGMCVLKYASDRTPVVIHRLGLDAFRDVIMPIVKSGSAS